MKILKNVEVNFELDGEVLVLNYDKHEEFKYQHRFNKDDTFYKEYEESSLKALNKMYNGGTFILTSEENPRLIDFRGNDYEGFFNGKTKRYDETIGIVYDADENMKDGIKSELKNDKIILGGQYNKRIWDIGEDEYETGIWYLYNPFNNYMRLLPYLKHVDGVIYYHNSMVKLKYNTKYIKETYGTVPNLKQKLKTVEDVWYNNMDNDDLSQEVCQLFYDKLRMMEESKLTLLDRINYEKMGESLEDYSITRYELFVKMLGRIGENVNMLNFVNGLL